MDRRTSLKLLISGLIGLTIDPEKLLWTPSKKAIFIPSQKQIDFLSNKGPISLYGIPYHRTGVKDNE